LQSFLSMTIYPIERQRLARFPLIFAFYMLNVLHFSTSGLFDLLT